MLIAVDALRAALAELNLPDEGDIFVVGKPVAARLGSFLDAVRADSEIAEVTAWAFNVEIVLRNGETWSIECLSPVAFRMYPAGANIWVRKTNMDLDELVGEINSVAARKTKEALQNA